MEWLEQMDTLLFLIAGQAGGGESIEAGHASTLGAEMIIDDQYRMTLNASFQGHAQWSMLYGDMGMFFSSKNSKPVSLLPWTKPITTSSADRTQSLRPTPL